MDITAPGLVGTLMTGHMPMAGRMGRALMRGGSLTKSRNVDAATGRELGPSKRSMSPPDPDDFGASSCLRPERTVYQQKVIML